MRFGIASVCCGMVVALASVNSNAAVIISEVVDGNRIASDGSAGSSPDDFLAFVELTNTGSSAVSLDGLHYMNLNNGAATSNFSSTPLSGTLPAGCTYYIAYEGEPDFGAGEHGAFETTYGFDPNEYTGGKFFNGDDVLLLLDTAYPGGGAAVDTGTIVDAYGVLGTDGTGEDWEYQDTYAFRNPSVSAANPTFTISEWTVGDVNDFDDEGAAGHVALTSVHECVPEPTAALLGLLGLLGLTAVGLRRRG